MDSISSERRSWNMSRIKSKDTAPEKAVRSFLHRSGFRFRLHCKSLPGKPDIVLPKYKAVVFVHGCFWHRHKGCKFAYTPKTRKQFWSDKFSNNTKRFSSVIKDLKAAGWKVLVVWECNLHEKDLQIVAQKIVKR